MVNVSLVVLALASLTLAAPHPSEVNYWFSLWVSFCIPLAASHPTVYRPVVIRTRRRGSSSMAHSRLSEILSATHPTRYVMHVLLRPTSARGLAHACPGLHRRRRTKLDRC